MKEEWIHYLEECRQRLLRYVLVLGVTFAILAYFAKNIYHWLTLPLLAHLAKDASLIAISVPAPFLVPFKSAFAASVFLTVPYLCYQIWMFVAPALYQKEKRLVWLLLASSSLLFYLGVVFAYFVVLPLVFQFFIYVAPAGVEVKPDIGQYFSFTMRLFFAFGFCFEVPVVMLLLVWMGF